MSLGGDRDRSVSAVLDLVPRKRERTGLRCGGVGGGPSGLIEASAIVSSLIGVGRVVMMLNDEPAVSRGVVSAVDPGSLASLTREP